MNTSEQDWIDKYRAATADVKPAEGTRWANMMRKLAVILGGEKVTAEKKGVDLAIPQGKAVSPSKGSKGVQEETAA